MYIQLQLQYLSSQTRTLWMLSCITAARRGHSSPARLSQYLSKPATHLQEKGDMREAGGRRGNRQEVGGMR